jgi:hypothetical protein
MPRLPIVILAITCGTARAEPNPEAEKLFRDGRTLLKDGKLAPACDAFAGSAKLEPSVGTFLNLGDCRARLGQTASAWAAFVEARRLAHRLADARETEANRRTVELEPKLSYLTISVSAPVRGMEIVRGAQTFDATVWGQSVPVDPGTFAITARATGYDSWSTSIAVKPDGDHPAVVVPPLRLRPIPIQIVRAKATPILTPKRDVAIGLAAVGVAALVVSGIVALDAKSLQDQARASCPADLPCRDPDAVHASDKAVSRATIATVIGGAGLVAIGAGVALWFVGKPTETRVTPTLAPGSVAVTLTGSF